jgi:flagellar protein FliS
MRPERRAIAKLLEKDAVNMGVKGAVDAMFNRDAIKAYQTAEQDFLVEGANPHDLVQILFTHFLVSLERARSALETKDLAAKSEHLTKALTIVHVLSTSLDFERGGEVAQSLEQIYTWARKKLIEASFQNSIPAIDEVHASMSEIAEAWNSISAAKAA